MSTIKRCCSALAPLPGLLILLYPLLLTGNEADDWDQTLSRAATAADYLVNTVERHPGIIFAHKNGRRDWEYVNRGVIRLDSDQRIDKHTVFEIGSITKVFTALLLTDMINKGEVQATDSIVKYLPGASWPDELSEITLIHLATHSSGLPRRPNNLPLEGSRGPYESYTKAHLLTMLRDVELDYPPGTEFSYSNVAFGLLGVILSEAADLPLGRLFEDRIFEPIGMESTGFEPEFDRQVAVPHDSAGKDVVGFWSFDALSAAGGLYSTAHDLSLFADTFLGRRQSAVTEIALMTMTEEFPIPGSAERRHLGWVRPDVVDGHILFNHDGGTGGSRAIFLVEPEDESATIVLSNAATAVMEYAWYVHVPGRNLPERQKLHPVDLPKDRARAFVGDYLLDAGETIQILLVNEQLFSKIGDGALFPVFPYGEDRLFYRVGEAQLIFDFSEDGVASSVALVTPGGRDIALRAEFRD